MKRLNPVVEMKDIYVSCSVKLEPEGSNLEEGDSWVGVGVFDVQGNLDIRR